MNKINKSDELINVNKELAFQKEEKKKRAAELIIANKELLFQNEEKEKRAEELVIANKELVFQNEEKEKRAAELVIANKELVFQNEEKEKRAAELVIANKELVFQNEEKEKRAAELVIANRELVFQNEEKEKRAAELIIANKELVFQNEEREKRDEELIIANKELVFQNQEKEKRAAELVIANKELVFQNKQKEKMTADLIQRNKDLEQFTYIISHNLRAPVANIIGLSYRLQQVDLADDIKKQIAGGLSTSVKKLDEVIRDLNDILKVRQKVDESKQLINLTQFASDIHLSIEKMIENENAVIVWNFSEVDEILTIKSYLHSIFYNLISNSLKYRQPGIPPAIEIRSQKLNNKIILLFKDNGLGIDLRNLSDHVFGLYKRFHTDRAEGKGIGLYMVKTQVESMGGKISISSEVNKGTEFKIEFET
jgi:signal transduction histidine kinase